jgi:hypothetical protein
MSSKTKTKTATTPWTPATPYITGAMGDMKGAYDTAQGTINKWSPALDQAIQKIQQDIASPPQYVTDARSQLDKTINGDYLNPERNPYSAGMAKLIADRTQGGYNATFGASGRSHGGLAALLSSQGVGDALGNFYGNIYESERGRQQQAIGAAPGFHGDEFTGINELFPAVANTAMLPVNAANAYGQGITGASSPYNTQTTTQKTPLLPQALGLAGMIGSAFMPMPGVGGGLGSIMVGGGTQNYFNAHPFGG